MPTSKAAYISATTRGRVSAGARSVARASPAVCATCRPAPTNRKARAAAASPNHTGARLSPDIRIRANGMIERPPNWSIVPSQMYGTRFQPSSDRWVSERNPISARNGATTSGAPTISDTSHADMPSSTIITRLSVPINSTVAMPTVTWNSDRRSRRDSGSCGLAASANGRNSGPSRVHSRVTRPTAAEPVAPFTIPRPRARVPSPATCRSRSRCASCRPPARSTMRVLPRSARAACLRRPVR